MEHDLKSLTIASLLEGYQEKRWSVREIVSVALDRIRNTNEQLNSFLEIAGETAFQQAELMEERLSDIHSFPLYGVPISIKDVFMVQGMHTTAGSRILENYVAPYTATCIQHLEDAGAIIIGKTNCDEFAMGSSNENSAFGVVRNPYDLERVPGGSSGGSAVSVSASQCLGSIGTDTGGSIRQPAALCGVVGLKPTYGRVSRYGIVAFASSLDQAGPFAKSVWDCARLAEILSGSDLRDATCSTSALPRYTKILSEWPKVHALARMRIGVCKSMLEGATSDILAAFEKTVQDLESDGAQIVWVDLPNVKLGLSSYYVLAPSECSSNLARYDGIHFGLQSGQRSGTIDDLIAQTRSEGFGPEVKTRIMLGTFALSQGYYEAYYGKAMQARALIRSDFHRAFSQCDAVVTPTSPTTAFRLGERSTDAISMYLSDVYTLPASLAGLPALSVPCGFGQGHMPIGFQMIGREFEEGRLFAIARCVERRHPWEPPPI